ncbi:ComF family protein [Lentimicrobium sp. S6]|uniref:ComF family protein n=1 Tax=Lentimicrobium sp. S6 TaxID=2735872 RepID=UPI001555CE5C|nr:ComF family protein [Lentimicrobium sp. S6]NPD44929.1 ComF family protein [Lentimicrobium sp. S6]
MIQSLLEDFLNLIYPRTCMACGNTLFRHEEVICSHCLIHLPKTFYHKDPKNPLLSLFWGKIPIEMVSSFYFYNKGNKVQNLIHQLKYNKQPEIGVYLGKRYGVFLKKSECFRHVNLIIPVPLHHSKQKIRGYNQAEMIAKGLSESMDIPYDYTSFIRSSETETQTKKTKLERWENVKNKFKVEEVDKLKNQHILLVDDVITTGSTLEACAQVLLEVEGVKISMVSMAAAHR